MGDGGEGCGGSDFDSGAEGGDLGDTGACEDTGGEATASETGEVGVSTEQSSGLENTGASSFNNSEHSSFSNFSYNETGKDSLDMPGMNDHIHGKDPSRSNERYVSTDRTITSEKFDTIATQSKSLSYEYAAAHCPDRANELSAKANQEVTNARLDKASNFKKDVCGTHSMRTGEIRTSDLLTEKATEHTLNHEFMHSASYQSKEYSENDKESVEKLTSGIRDHVTVVDKTDCTKIEYDTNRSLNEGLTENYTLRAEKEANFESGVSAYSTSRAYASTLESIAGNENVSEAYFNGQREALEDRCNTLGKDENTWSDINSLLDIITSPQENNSPERQQAKKDAQNELENIFETMNRSRMEEIQNERNNQPNG